MTSAPHHWSQITPPTSQNCFSSLGSDGNKESRKTVGGTPISNIINICILLCVISVVATQQPPSSWKHADQEEHRWTRPQHRQVERAGMSRGCPFRGCETCHAIMPNIFEYLRILPTQEHAKMSGSSSASSACTVCLQVQRKSSLQAPTKC